MIGRSRPGTRHDDSGVSIHALQQGAVTSNLVYHDSSRMVAKEAIFAMQHRQQREVNRESMYQRLFQGILKSYSTHTIRQISHQRHKSIHLGRGRIKSNTLQTGTKLAYRRLIVPHVMMESLSCTKPAEPFCWKLARWRRM